MLKFIRAFFVVLILFIATPVFSAVQSSSPVSATMGMPDSSGNHAITVDSDRYVTFSGGVYGKLEVKTTDDTLTASESGKIFIINPVGGSPVTITLPTAALGPITESSLYFTFVQGQSSGLGNAASKSFLIDPASTDKFVFTNSAAANTFAEGDRLQNSGFTGDSVTIIAGPDNTWYAINARGTWSDAN